LDSDRIYRHFCMGARTLEVVGDRWTLLIVRDLTLGPQRFTDLQRSLNEITATRLTARLRQLESAGVVSRDDSRPGRDVWYRLTDAGRDLAPVVDDLIFWGMQHRLQGPVAGEPVPAQATIIGTKVWLNRYGPKLAGDLTWVWRFSDGDAYTFRLVDGAWQVTRGAASSAAVTVRATLRAWAAFLTSPRPKPRLPRKGITLEGRRAELKRFASAFTAELAQS
jgi:DNA-binding HxlR family transcriptional regulator